MPFKDLYDKSPDDFKPQEGSQWQHIGELAQKLRSKVDKAIVAGNSEVAESYHNRLIEIEALEYFARKAMDK